MKKRMFITTIVMMLVLAVALTTSSLAWFTTSVGNVTASTATFYARTADTGADLVIKDDAGDAWGRSIALMKSGDSNSAAADAQKLNPLVPTAALVADATVGDDFVGLIKKAGVADVQQAWRGTVWPNAMSFNSVKIDSNNKYIVNSASDILTVNNVTDGASSGEYFFREFFIKNASSTTDMTAISFKLRADLAVDSTTGAGDYTARGVAAFIIFDEITFAAEKTIPTSALTNPGKKVVAYDQEPGENEVKESELGKGLTAWVPVAAFSLVSQDSNNSSIYDAAAWQYANFSLKTNGTTYDFNGVNAGNGQRTNGDNTTDLRFQAQDGYMAYTTDSTTNPPTVSTDEYVLNATNLANLENKVLDNTGAIATRDTALSTTGFIAMKAGEEYMVRMYYWLDGATLTGLTDATVSALDLTIANKD